MGGLAVRLFYGTGPLATGIKERGTNAVGFNANTKPSGAPRQAMLVDRKITTIFLCFLFHRVNVLDGCLHDKILPSWRTTSPTFIQSFRNATPSSNEAPTDEN